MTQKQTVNTQMVGDLYEHQTATALKWVPILMYHRVVDVVEDPNPFNICISKEELAHQMSYLGSKGYQSIHLDDFAEAAIEGATLQRRRKIPRDRNL